MGKLWMFMGTGVLVALTLWLSAALLPACGANRTVFSTWIDWCPVNKHQQNEERLAALTTSNRNLQLRIDAYERELALKQCLPAEAPPQSDRIDWNAWSGKQIGLLEGCWDLESRFTTTNRQTGEPSRYQTWKMCFDARGVGREEMRADSGSVCSGPVQGSFDASGSLAIEEPGNLTCSDGGFIYRLKSTCSLNDDGTASCVVTQPEIGSSTTVEFRRAARGN